ncbi:MAG: 1-acyl-sn-glycerol-3-phosphate acyltransferase [Acidobacteria bacterium]|nr:1-acyl-sn-glycerol-3-phosphate acyltransferase [Acidobacteriota bacterium]
MASRSEMSLRKRSRRWWRLIRAVAICFAVLFEVPIRAIAGMFSSRSLAFDRDTLVADACCRLSRRILSVLGVTVIPPNRREVGQGSLIVSNHLSYLDVLVIGSIYSGKGSGSIGFVAKSEVAAWPLIGWLARLGGALFLQRGVVISSVRTVYRVSQALRAGRQMHVFPEGTTTDGRDLTTFHPLFFASAIRSGRPVLPLTLRVEEVIEDGVTLSSPNEIVCWYGDTFFLQHFWRLLLIDSARLSLIEHAAIPVSRVDRALGLASRVERTINSALELRDIPGLRSETEPGDLPLDLLAGALLFSLFVNPGNKDAREMIPLIDEKFPVTGLPPQYCTSQNSTISLTEPFINQNSLVVKKL